MSHDTHREQELADELINALHENDRQRARYMAGAIPNDEHLAARLRLKDALEAYRRWLDAQ